MYAKIYRFWSILPELLIKHGSWNWQEWFVFSNNKAGLGFNSAFKSLSSLSSLSWLRLLTCLTTFLGLFSCSRGVRQQTSKLVRPSLQNNLRVAKPKLIFNMLYVHIWQVRFFAQVIWLSPLDWVANITSEGDLTALVVFLVVHFSIYFNSPITEYKKI